MVRAVSEAEAAALPYPIVYVYQDGTIRELHQTEKQYLETAFSPGDGGRPAVKDTLAQLNGWGDIQGFCLRSGIPANFTILPAPINVPTPEPMTRERTIELCNKTGFTYHEMPNGTVNLKRKRKWWKIW
jgi:hypothetical protein